MKHTFSGAAAIGSLWITLALAAHAAAPAISYQPRNQSVILHQRAAFGVIADGTVPFNYQWLKNGAPIAGATNDQIRIEHVEFPDEANYSVTVSNAEGSVTSTNAALAVRLPHAGDLDGTVATGGSIGNRVISIAVQPDGKVVIAGEFTNVDGLARGRVARLNADGTTDCTFMDGLAGVAGVVNSVALQTDGKILIGGQFTNVNGVVRSDLARLNKDGSLDTTFLNGLSGFYTVRDFDAMVSSVAVQNDAKIVVSGTFSTVNGVTCSNIVRLCTDGTVDASFHGNLAQPTFAMLLQPDGKILVSGRGTNTVIRLNQDGTFDCAWDLHSLFGNNGVLSMALEDDGNIIVGGACDCGYKGTPLPRVARILSNGGYQTNAFQGLPNLVSTVAVQGDGKVLIGGSMAGNGIALIRFNHDGTWDKAITLQALGFSNADIFSTAHQSDGKILIGGWIFGNRSSIARLNADDTLDNSFANSVPTTDAYVGSAIVQPDGRLLIAGDFSTVYGVPRHGIARLNPEGTLDATFGDALVSGQLVNNEVNSVSLQNDGKVLIGGNFLTVGGAAHGGIARLNADGTCDATFQASVLEQYNNPGIVYALIVQPDQKILIGGNFLTVNGEGHTNIARLNTDGTLDASFLAQAEGSTYLNVEQLVVQTDGHILLAGGFSKIDGENRQYFARLNPDGSLDEDFAPNLAGGIPAIVLQPDGKIITGRNRLNPDGTIDPTFTNSTYAGWMLLQEDGKIIEGGDTVTVRLNPDGSIDSSFQSDQIGIPLATLAGGGILIGGDLRRLWGDDHSPVLNPPTVGPNVVSVTWHAISNRTYRLQYTEDLLANDWTDLPGDVCATNDLAGKTDLTAGKANQRYYRLRQLQ
jgi:uncharacterized delta-60 repeat protein